MATKVIDWKAARPTPGNTLQSSLRSIDRREWWLWSSAFIITLLLTMGIVSFVFPLSQGDMLFSSMGRTTRGLVGLVLLFDLYTLYQQQQIHSMRRRLIEREQLFRLISDNAGDMIALVDSEGQRNYISPAYERVLGYSPDSLLQTSVLEQVHGEDRDLLSRAMAEARLSGENQRVEYRIAHQDGSWHDMESTVNLIPSESASSAQLVIVNRDITERKRLEKQLFQAQKMEAIGRLSGGIAHDFNNLLGVIIGYGEILQEQPALTDTTRTSVQEILKAGRRAASLTRQLLAFSRQQVLEPKVMSLNCVISETANMIRRLIGDDIDLTLSLHPQDGKVKADQGQIEQVLLNLAVNARDAMPNGGRIFIQTSEFLMDPAFVRQYPYPVKPGAYIRLAFSDNGIGMNTDIKAHIFEPFFTTKEKGKGTGLGLAMVYGIVKQSGGYIDVQSEPGKGATFTIYLPKVEVAAARQEHASSSVGLQRGNETILVVEDEPSMRHLTSYILKLCGYTVLAAKDGPEALQINRRYQDPIHLLLTDFVMPGLSGDALARQILEQRPDIAILYMSGYAGQKVGGEVLEEGAFFLAKPFTRESLAGKIRDVLDWHKAKPASGS
ncbi:MAG: PAS domain S-box protein [Acidobacteria bacterium]|nr:PAS domain S-box protein [Acidobacteriota bacterium]